MKGRPHAITIFIPNRTPPHRRHPVCHSYKSTNLNSQLPPSPLIFQLDGNIPNIPPLNLQPKWEQQMSNLPPLGNSKYNQRPEPPVQNPYMQLPTPKPSITERFAIPTVYNPPKPLIIPPKSKIVQPDMRKKASIRSKLTF